MLAEGKLAKARKHGEKLLGSYRGAHGNEIELWENRVRVPRTGTKEDWWSNVTKRFLREHYFQDGPVEARVESHGADERYLVVEVTTSSASFSASRTMPRRHGSWRSR